MRCQELAVVDGEHFIHRTGKLQTQVWLLFDIMLTENVIQLGITFPSKTYFWLQFSCIETLFFRDWLVLLYTVAYSKITLGCQSLSATTGVAGHLQYNLDTNGLEKEEFLFLSVIVIY